MAQLLIGLIGWQVQLIETTKHGTTGSQSVRVKPLILYVCTSPLYQSPFSPCVGRRPPVCGPVISVDLELLNAIHALKCHKTMERHFGGACQKLDELGTVSLFTRTQGCPEPLNLKR